MVGAFRKYLHALDSDAADKKFLLAISGGLDSVVMTELFKLSGYSYSIAHCNFQLRGKESDQDLKFVKNLASANNVPFFSVDFDTEKFCNEHKLSVQMGARQLRYEWLEETVRKNGMDYLVTAHHADDTIETFFINLIRGTGISGLHGIKAKNENIIRPMLNFHRKDIAKFAVEHYLKWREDSSNNSDKYERNRIRHHVLPALLEISSNVKESIIATIGTLGKTEQLLKDAVSRATQQFIEKQGENTVIHFNFFSQLFPPVEYLYETIKIMGFNYEQCKQIIESAKGQPGKVFLSNTHRIIIDRKKLIIEPLPGNDENYIQEISKEERQVLFGVNKYTFEVQKRSKGFPIPKELWKAALDFDKLQFPLEIRKWQEGDRFYPLGMNKPKKVSDFLIDNKVSLPDKERVYVLISGNDIAWLIGYRLDERFKITEGTKNVYLCESQNAI